MLIYPAIDLFGGKAVRLYKGDYGKMTVYSDDPVSVARDFAADGAKRVHLVDLEGAKMGATLNFGVICAIKEKTKLFCEVGGGIRSLETIEKYVSAGIDRVILGTAALDEAFLASAVLRHGEKIAVGVDIKDGFVAVKGWTQTTGTDPFEFCKRLESVGVTTVICTDVSKDGAMKGTNAELYKKLSQTTSLNLIASGGVSGIDDVKALAAIGIHGAIIGKAYYVGAIDLAEAIEAAK